MSYTYLLDLYKAVDEKIDQIRSEQQATPPGSEHHHYLRGQYHCLSRFRTFLQENFHAKLPRRIQKTLQPVMRNINERPG